MYLKYEEIGGFLGVYQNIKKQKLPFKTSYKLTKIHSILTPEFDFFKEELNKLIEEFAKRDENGEMVAAEGGIKIQEGREKEFEVKVEELTSLSVEVQFPLIAAEELEMLDFSVEEMEPLMIFIED